MSARLAGSEWAYSSSFRVLVVCESRVFILILAGNIFAAVFSPYIPSTGSSPAMYGFFGIMIVDLLQTWQLQKSGMFRLLMLLLQVCVAVWSNTHSRSPSFWQSARCPGSTTLPTSAVRILIFVADSIIRIHLRHHWFCGLSSLHHLWEVGQVSKAVCRP